MSLAAIYKRAAMQLNGILGCILGSDHALIHKEKIFWFCPWEILLQPIICSISIRRLMLCYSAVWTVHNFSCLPQKSFFYTWNTV